MLMRVHLMCNLQRFKLWNVFFQGLMLGRESLWLPAVDSIPTMAQLMGKPQSFQALPLDHESRNSLPNRSWNSPPKQHKKRSDLCYSILTVDSHCWWSYATCGKAINCKADIDVTLDQTLTPWRQRLSCSAKRALRETAILCWAPGTVKTHMRRGNECNQCCNYELSNAVQGLPLMQHFRCCWCHPVVGGGRWAGERLWPDCWYSTCTLKAL